MSILEQSPRGIEHVAVCGAAENGPYKPECSVNPVAVPPCAQVRASRAKRPPTRGARRLPAPGADRRSRRSDPLARPWVHDLEAHTLTPKTPGTGGQSYRRCQSQRYELWLGGSFARGFEVSVEAARRQGQ